MLGRTVGEIERGMGAVELGEWRRLCDEEVIGQERDDYWRAMMISTYVNAHRDTRKRSQPYGLSEFMPRRRTDEDDVDGGRSYSDDELMDFLSGAHS